MVIPFLRSKVDGECGFAAAAVLCTWPMNLGPCSPFGQWENAICDRSHDDRCRPSQRGVRRPCIRGAKPCHGSPHASNGRLHGCNANLHGSNANLHGCNANLYGCNANLARFPRKVARFPRKLARFRRKVARFRWKAARFRWKAARFQRQVGRFQHQARRFQRMLRARPMLDFEPRYGGHRRQPGGMTIQYVLSRPTLTIEPVKCPAA